MQNAGKRSVVVDPSGEDGRERLLGLLDRADVWIESARPGSLAALGLGAERVRAQNPTLVVLSITDFGQTGPYRDWVATDWTLLAMGGVLSRSGLPGRESLVPPGEMALQVTAAQAAWAVLAAYWNRLESGHGDTIDFSLYQATVQVIDPRGVRGHRPGRRLRGHGDRRRPARTRSSAAATATCGSCSWRRASGSAIARGWASRRTSRTPSSRRSRGAPARPAGSTRRSKTISAIAASTS